MKDVSYFRGTFVWLTSDASLRLGVPKRRPWLVIQNNDLDVIGTRILVYVSSVLGADVLDGRDRVRMPYDSDVAIFPDRKNKLHNVSYVRCACLYTVTVTEIDKATGGKLDPDSDEMKRIDEALRLALKL